MTPTMPIVDARPAEAIWSMTVFLLESLIFILVGQDLPYAARALSTFSLRQLLAYAGIISAVVILVRLIWVWPSAYLPRLASRGRLPPWKWVLFVGWAGMRGGDSLVLALALPLATRSGAPFPARDLIIFLTFSVIFATLVLQAVTLTPLLRFLGLSGSEDDDKEEAHARRVVAEVALQRLEKARSRDDVPPELLRSLRKQLEKKAVRWSTRDVDGHGRKDAEHRAVKRVGGPEAESESRAYRKLHGEILDAEREAVVKLRDQNVISDQVMHRVLRDIDLETMVVEATEDDAPSSPYDFE